MTRSVGRIGVRYAKDIHGGVCMKLYFNDQSQVNQCTLVNKHMFYKWSLWETSEGKFMSV